MAADPTATYRKQQGLAPVTQSYDPKVVGWIVQAAGATGADPAALLATSLQESGARRGAVGDGGTSFGPFQMHRGGALGTHSPAWANTYAPVLNRAQEFARLQVHGGTGAAAVQRPADRSLYAEGVDKYLAQAKAILAHYQGGAPATPAAPKAPKIPAAPTTQTASGVIPGNDLLQSLIDSSAANAGISSIQLPQMLAPPVPQLQQPAKPGKQPQQPAAKGAFGKVVTMPNPKIIGVPYQGTHTLGNWESDNATDIAMPTGTPIYAPTAGIIGSQIGSLGASSGSRFAGLRVHLKTGGNELYYAHLSRLTVKAGQRVRAGQIIGYSGAANGVQHLHLGVLKGDPRRFA